MSEPLDTTPCTRPSASSTNGTLASLRGCAGGITRAVLDFSHSANRHLLCIKGASAPPRQNIHTSTDIAAGTHPPLPPAPGPRPRRPWSPAPRPDSVVVTEHRKEPRLCHNHLKRLSRQLADR